MGLSLVALYPILVGLWRVILPIIQQKRNFNLNIVDDNERMLQLLGELVSNDKDLHVVGTAKDGEEAYELIKEKEPDVVLLDIIMPNKDGNDAIKEIIEYDPNATIFIASSVGTQTQLKSALENGAKDFVQKPLDSNQVINLLEKYIGGK